MAFNVVEMIFRGKNQVKPAVASVNGDLAKLVSFAGKLTKAFAAAGVGLLVKQVVGNVRATLDELGDLQDTAKRLGVGVETLQQLRFVASQTGVSVGALESSMGIFTRKVGEMSVAMKGPLFDAFAFFKIELKDSKGEIRSVDDLLVEYVKKLGGVEDATQRNALAARAFGRGGAAISQMAIDGAKSFDDLMEKARDLGLVLDDELVARMETLGDDFEAAAQVIDLQFKRALIEIAPFVVQAAQGISGLIVELNKFMALRAVLNSQGDITTKFATKNIEEATSALAGYEAGLARALDRKKLRASGHEQTIMQWLVPTENLDANIKDYEAKIARLKNVIAVGKNPEQADMTRALGIARATENLKKLGIVVGEVKKGTGALLSDPSGGGGGGGGKAGGTADMVRALQQEAEKLGASSDIARAKLEALFELQQAQREAPKNTAAQTAALEIYRLKLVEIAKAERDLAIAQGETLASAQRAQATASQRAQLLLSIPANANPQERALIQAQAELQSAQMDRLFAFQDAQQEITNDEIVNDAQKHQIMLLNRSTFESDMAIIAQEGADERKRIVESEGQGFRDLFKIDFEQIGIRAVENLGNAVADLFVRIGQGQVSVSEGIREIVSQLGGTALNELAQIGFKAGGGALTELLSPKKDPAAVTGEAAGLAQGAAETMLSAAGIQAGAGASMTSAALTTASSIVQQLVGLTGEQLAASTNLAAGTLMVTASGAMAAAAATMLSAAGAGAIGGALPLASGGLINAAGLAYLHPNEVVAGTGELKKIVAEAGGGGGGNVSVSITVGAQGGINSGVSREGGPDADQREQGRAWEAAFRRMLREEQRPGGVLEGSSRRRSR